MQCVHSLKVVLVVIFSSVNCSLNTVSLIDGVGHSVAGTVHKTVGQLGVAGSAVQPCNTLHQTTSIVNVPVQRVVQQPVIHTEYHQVEMVHTHVVPPAKVVQVPVLPKPPKIQFATIELPKLVPVPAPALPPVMLPVIHKLPKIKPQFVEVSRPTLAPVVIPIPPLPQVKPVAAVLPPAPCVTYMEIPLTKPKPFKVPIIPKLQPIKYLEVELPAPAPLRIPVLPKLAPPKFVQIEMPVIKPVKIAPLPKMKPLVLPPLPKIELPVYKPVPIISVPQSVQVMPCSRVMPMPCPCSSCMQSYSPPVYPYAYSCGYQQAPPMYHGQYHRYPPQGYSGYQQSLHTSSYSGPSRGPVLPSVHKFYPYARSQIQENRGSVVSSQENQTLSSGNRLLEGTVVVLPEIANSTNAS